jgi:tetratricopeptide (TPR) repeat protein
LPEEDLRRYVANLERANLLYETQPFPDLEYTFKHALTHQVTYAGLLHDSRREIHVAILECLEKLYGDRLSEHVEGLAHHSFHGEIWPKALIYLRQAGAKAVERPANREAVLLFEQALDVLERLPNDHNALDQAIDIRFDIRNALQPLGELQEIEKHLREAERLAGQLGDERRLGWVASYLAEHFRMRGEADKAAVAGGRALKIARELQDFPLQVVTNLPMGLLYHATGEYRRATEFLRSNVEQLGGKLQQERFGLFGLPSVLSRSFLAWCFAETGEFKKGFIMGEEAVQLAETSCHPFSMMYAHLGIGIVNLRFGDLQRAIEILERALQLGGATKIPVGYSYAVSYLGYALTLVGKPEEGVPLLEQSTSPAVSKMFVARHSLRVAYLGEAYLLNGRIEDAAAAATHALELARDHKERGHEAYALYLLGKVATQRCSAVTAERYYRSALDLAQHLGMRPLAAHCHWGLAKCFGRLGVQISNQLHAAEAAPNFEI